VLVWEPPHRIVLTWQIAPGWVYEPDPARASQVEVRFIADASRQRTRIQFEHRRLERYAEQTERMRSVLDALAVPQACSTRTPNRWPPPASPAREEHCDVYLQ
jgi:uncharacterized protein YndB with AHSA1/START domain